MRPNLRTYRVAAVAAVAGVVAAMLTACGSESEGTAGSNSSCTGEPLKIMTISTLSGGIGLHPEIPEATRAAATAINGDCGLKRPIDVIVCDDKFDANVASQCARDAVSEKVLAVVGDDGQFAEQSLPILKAAGIPTVGFYQNGQAASTSPNSFPNVFGLVLLRGEVGAALSLGAKKIVLVPIDTPSVDFLVSTASRMLEEAGAELVGVIPVPPNVTDMTPYAAQAVATGAEAIIPVLTEGPFLQLLNALDQQGTRIEDMPLFGSALTSTPAVVAKWGEIANGLYIVGQSWPVSDDANDGIKRLRAELRAIGADPQGQSDFSVAAWTGMHLIAELMADVPTIDSATLVAKLASAGRIDRPELAPFDYSRPAFPDDPTLSKLRVFSSSVVITRVQDGAIVPVTEGFVDTLEEFALTTR